MAKEFEITDEDRKLSKPQTPFDVPVRRSEPKIVPEDNTKEEISDPLDIDPKKGFFFYLKMPAIIFVAVMGGYLIGRLHMGIGNVIILGYAVYFIYSRKIRKFRNTLRSLVLHDARREKAKYSGETVEWLNYIVRKFWDVAEPVVSNDIYQTVNRELLKVCPPFLTDLRLTEFTLGSRAPFIDRITYHSSTDDTVTVDVSFGFVPLEASKEVVNYFLGEKKRWNSKIILKARIGGRNAVGINLPILVKEIHFLGRVRVTLNLFPKNTFIKTAEICFMELPEFDFTLVPLKTVDIMDVPGLSRWITNIINNVMTTVIVNPNSLTIDIDKIAISKGYNTGVACVQLLSLENSEDEELVGELDMDGLSLYQTSVRRGTNIVFNEYFYFIVQNVDGKVGLIFNDSSDSLNRTLGGIHLVNVHLEGENEDEISDLKINDKKVEVCPVKKPKPRRTHFNKIRLVRNESTYAFLNTNIEYFPIRKEKTNSAIVRLTLVGAENIQGLDDNKGAIYSSYCNIIVSPLNMNKNSIPIDYVQNTTAATSLIVSGIVKPEDGRITEITPGSQSISTKLIPPTSSTFYAFESKRIFDTNSPNYNETFEFFSRDLSVDVVSICIINEKNRGIIGKVGIPLSDVSDGKACKYKIKDARCGKIEVKFDLSYIELKKEEDEMYDFTHVQKISIDTVSEKGVFNATIETNTDCFVVDSFTSTLPINRSVYVPLLKNDTIKFRLFKETINGDVFIGDDMIEVTRSVDVKKVALILNEQISVTLRVETEPLRDLNSSGNLSSLKIMQVKLGNFYGLNEEVSAEFYSNNEMKKASCYSRDRKINNVFTLFVGKEKNEMLIKNGDQGENRVLGRCSLDLENQDKRVVLNDKGLSVGLQTRVQFCNFMPLSTLKKGFLEVYIKSVRNIKSSEKGTVDAYIKVLVNDSKVFRTKTVRDTSDPLFNESFIIRADKLRDTFNIQVFDEGSSSKNSLLSFVEFPLHNINEGFSEIPFKLVDAKSFKDSGSILRVGFNFCKDHSTLKIKKRGILSDFFGF